MGFLLGLCLIGAAAPPAEPPVTSSLRYVDVTVDATPTNGRGVQVVTVRLKIQQHHRIAGRPHSPVGSAFHFVNLKLSTRDAKTRIDVIYPKGRESKEGLAPEVVHEDEIALQAVIQRADGDRSAVQGEVEFRVMGTVF
jgi:hypothetical protein